MCFKNIFALLLFFCLSFTGNAQHTTFDYGNLNGTLFTNKFFGFKVNVPEQWIVKTEQQKKEMQELGGKLLAGDNASMKTLVKAAEVKTANLLSVSQYEQGAPVDFNPSFAIVAENISSSPGIKTGNDYLFHAKRLMASSQVKFSFDKDVYNQKIGNQDFAVLEASLTFPTATVKQYYYVTIKNNYSLIFMLTFLSPENKTALDNILNTLTFE